MATGFGLLRLSPRAFWSMTPKEFADIQTSRLPLPNGWSVGEQYRRPQTIVPTVSTTATHHGNG